MSVHKVHHVVYTIFHNFHIGVKRLSDKALDTRKPFFETHLGIASFIDTADHDSVFCQCLLQKPDDVLFHAVDPQRQRLDHQDILIFIHDQSRQKVCLAKDQTTGGSIHRILAVLPCIFHTPPQKIFINQLIRFSCHHADADLGILVDITTSHDISVKVMYQYNITIGKSSHDGVDLIIIDPESARLQASSFPFFQCYYCFCHTFLLSLFPVLSSGASERPLHILPVVFLSDDRPANVCAP